MKAELIIERGQAKFTQPIYLKPTAKSRLPVPARQIGWMSEFGEQLDLPLTGNGQAICPATGKRYTLQNGVVSTSET